MTDSLYEQARAAIAARRVLQEGFPSGGIDLASHPTWERDLILAAVNAFAADTDALERAITVAHPIDEDDYCLGRHMHYEGAVLWAECPDARAALTALGVDQ